MQQTRSLKRPCFGLYDERYLLCVTKCPYTEACKQNIRCVECGQKTTVEEAFTYEGKRYCKACAFLYLMST